MAERETILDQILTISDSFQTEKDKICKPVLAYFTMKAHLQLHRSKRNELLMASFISKRVSRRFAP
jgi:hypothetical protein